MIDKALHFIFSLGLVLIIFEMFRRANPLYRREYWAYELVIALLFTLNLGNMKEFIDSLGYGVFEVGDIVYNYLGAFIAYMFLMIREGLKDYRLDRHLDKVIRELENEVMGEDDYELESE